MNWTYAGFVIVLGSVFIWSSYFTIFGDTPYFQFTSFVLALFTLLGLGALYGTYAND